MSLWILLVVINGHVATMDMPSKVVCEREAEVLRKVDAVNVVFCVNRDVTEITRRGK